jgi:hypothetical protein
MHDETENTRREMIAKQGTEERQALEKIHGQVWDTEQVRADFEVLGFLAPFVLCRRRSDGERGTLQFQHSPRYYYSFVSE